MKMKYLVRILPKTMVSFFSLNLALVKMQTKIHEKVFCCSADTVQTRCRRKVEALQRQIFLDKSPPCLKITHLNGEVI